MTMMNRLGTDRNSVPFRSVPVSGCFWAIPFRSGFNSKIYRKPEFYAKKAVKPVWAKFGPNCLHCCQFGPNLAQTALLSLQCCQFGPDLAQTALQCCQFGPNLAQSARLLLLPGYYYWCAAITKYMSYSKIAKFNVSVKL